MTAGLVVAGALPSVAMAQEDLRSPDARDAARDLPDQVAPPPSSITASSRTDHQDLRSPDARDAERDLAPIESPAAVVQVRDPQESGFDWGDAGVGAAAMVALFSIVAGGALLVTGRRRGRSARVATR